LCRIRCRKQRCRQLASCVCTLYSSVVQFISTEITISRGREASRRRHGQYNTVARHRRTDASAASVHTARRSVPPYSQCPSQQPPQLDTAHVTRRPTDGRCYVTTLTLAVSTYSTPCGGRARCDDASLNQIALAFSRPGGRKEGRKRRMPEGLADVGRSVSEQPCCAMSREAVTSTINAH